MLDRVKRWVNSLPAADRDLPILEHNGKYWTPNEILAQISSCPTCSLSQTLQSMLELRIPALSEYGKLWELAKSRLIIHLSRSPGGIAILGRGIVSNQALAHEVASETPFGKQLIQIEIEKMKRQLGMF